MTSQVMSLRTLTRITRRTVGSSTSQPRAPPGAAARCSNGSSALPDPGEERRRFPHARADDTRGSLLLVGDRRCRIALRAHPTIALGRAPPVRAPRPRPSSSPTTSRPGSQSHPGGCAIRRPAVGHHRASSSVRGSARTQSAGRSTAPGAIPADSALREMDCRSRSV